MKLLSRIVGRLNVLCVRFTSEGETTLSLVQYIFSKGKSISVDVSGKTLSNFPVIVLLSGRGVVTKDVSAANIVESITSNPETFIRTVMDGKISFVRREQLETVMNELGKSNIHPLRIECLPVDGEQLQERYIEKFCLECLHWKVALRPSAEGSVLASFIAKRFLFPSLAVLLLILLVNFAVSSRVEKEFNSANFELAALRKTSSAAAASNDKKEAAMEQFSHRLPHKASSLSDKIAAIIPEKVVLTELSIAPLLRHLETGKPVQQNENAVIIRGETSLSEEVAEFTEALTELRLGAVRLVSVEQDEERMVLTFRIEIAL